MIFNRAEYPPEFADHMPKTWIAKTGRWQFIIMEMNGRFTASYRLTKPTREVSASGTMMGPFATFDEAETAANDKWSEIKRLA